MAYCCVFNCFLPATSIYNNYMSAYTVVSNCFRSLHIVCKTVTATATAIAITIATTRTRTTATDFIKCYRVLFIITFQSLDAKHRSACRIVQPLSPPFVRYSLNIIPTATWAVAVGVGWWCCWCCCGMSCYG